MQTKQLKQLFVDTFALYYLTHLYHWNVVGNNFVALHSLFEEQYTNMWEAVDTIAERIRQCNEFVECDLADVVEETKIDGYLTTSHVDDMITTLLAKHRQIAALLETYINNGGDLTTQNLYITRKEFHIKAIWKLKALLQ